MHEPRPCNLDNGIFITDGYLVVLAFDAGRRALPVWLRGHPAGAHCRNCWAGPTANS